MAQRAGQQNALNQGNDQFARRGPNQGNDQFACGGPTCVCFRPQQEVYCMNCGHSFRGRRRMHCPAHPMTMFLLDVPCCPICHSLNITERPEV